MAGGCSPVARVMFPSENEMDIGERSLVKFHTGPICVTFVLPAHGPIQGPRARPVLEENQMLLVLQGPQYHP